ILVGTAHYEKDPKNLQDLPAVSNNLYTLRQILADPDIIVGPRQNIVTIEDPHDKADLTNCIIPVAKQATDLLFFYYAGHGLLGRQTKKLYLGTVRSSEAEADFDGFDFEQIRLMLGEAIAKKRILILDC